MADTPQQRLALWTPGQLTREGNCLGTGAYEVTCWVGSEGRQADGQPPPLQLCRLPLQAVVPTEGFLLTNRAFWEQNCWSFTPGVTEKLCALEY